MYIFPQLVQFTNMQLWNYFVSYFKKMYPIVSSWYLSNTIRSWPNCQALPLKVWNTVQSWRLNNLIHLYRVTISNCKCSVRFISRNRFTKQPHFSGTYFGRFHISLTTVTLFVREAQNTCDIELKVPVVCEVKSCWRANWAGVLFQRFQFAKIWWHLAIGMK